MYLLSGMQARSGSRERLPAPAGYPPRSRDLQGRNLAPKGARAQRVAAGKPEAEGPGLEAAAELQLPRSLGPDPRSCYMPNGVLLIFQESPSWMATKSVETVSPGIPVIESGWIMKVTVTE